LEVLLTRGDLSVVGELASLKDSLNVFRKRAKRVSKENQVSYPLPEQHVPVRESGEEYREMMIRSCDLDNAFHDVEPMENSSQYSMASSPIYRGGGEVQNESRNNSGAMAGSGSFQSGPGSARLADGQDLQLNNGLN